MTAPGCESGPVALARCPVVFRDGQWWLVAGAGAILATDPVFTSALDGYAAAAAAAERAVAELRARSGGEPDAGRGGPR
ncbi:hypothetical protein ABZ832_12430 [Streptantibioticus parmotrematis]|uniref:hypothetical protein n=1 Tax=Streptantibioticus parmotrematis TaxID=2873249 RepID=UPI003406C995